MARKGAKFIAKFSAINVTRHFRLSLSLSLSLCISLSLSHRAHLTHNIGSASALPIILGNIENTCPGFKGEVHTIFQMTKTYVKEKLHEEGW